MKHKNKRNEIPVSEYLRASDKNTGIRIPVRYGLKAFIQLYIVLTKWPREMIINIRLRFSGKLFFCAMITGPDCKV